MIVVRMQLCTHMREEVKSTQHHRLWLAASAYALTLAMLSFALRAHHRRQQKVLTNGHGGEGRRASMKGKRDARHMDGRDERREETGREKVRTNWS